MERERTFLPGGPALRAAASRSTIGLLVLLGLFVFLSACATVPKAPPFVAKQSQQGLVKWQAKNAAPLVCEAVLSQSEMSATRLQLYKGTAQVLLQVTLSHDNLVEASGPLAGRSWRGEAGSAPLPLQTWVKLLQDYRTSSSWPDGQTELHSANTRTAIVVSQGKPSSLSVINDLSGETITVTLQ